MSNKNRGKVLPVPAAEQHEELPSLRFCDLDDGELEMATPSEDIEAALRRTLGVRDTGSLLTRLLGNTAEVMADFRCGASELNDAAALLESIAPQDAAEGMLASQMVASYSAAMRALRLASMEEQTFHGRQAYINLSTKLMRTYTAQLDALKRYRSKARQTMIVKHVHVHEGGQAIVGNVTEGEGRGGKE